jgi:peptidoglycan/LPS O-acetylase OafA/YrhL
MATETNRPAIGLDLMRGLAAIEVFLGHVRGGSFVEYGALPLHQRTLLVAVIFGATRMGHEAVLVFFVLSGYLVFGQVLRRSLEGRFSVTPTLLIGRRASFCR